MDPDMERVDPDPELLRILLTRTSDARDSQNVIVWTVVSVFAATNAVLVTAAATAMGRPWSVIVISVVGFVGAVFGSLLVDRSLRFLEFHERVSHKIECQLKVPEELRLTWLPDEPQAVPAEMGQSVRAKRLLRYFSLAMGVAWCFVSAVAAIRVAAPATGWLPGALAVVLAILLAALVRCARVVLEG